MVDSVIPCIYTGKSEFDGREPYIPAPELIEAVNLTIFLQKRPLLLKGEPGCGKTRLARAVADELKLPYESWYIQSTTRAKDGFYTYDAIARLQDAQLAQHDEQKRSKVNDPNNYIRLGPLGRAFLFSLDKSQRQELGLLGCEFQKSLEQSQYNFSEKPQRCVVLIDEIDKADIDFPNDLLQALDEGRFLIQETGGEIKANSKYLPIIFITSNDEKDLPDAFLRRCLFHYIKFPQESELINIINAHFPKSQPAVIGAAVRRFQLLRNKMEENIGKTGKKVSTSELIDWFTILREYPEDEALSKLEGELPFAGVLLKYWKDYRDYLLPSQEEQK
ncbi:MoxR family ATPase [Okeanomitos corallinicola TIOX110]|uniref:MoxR family ATPase n=1 Tax=Okeanomitos corallinicola TIOX110 TaxID=3133117 RepID=A0ABZ2UWE7_9CYAN